MAFIQGSVDRQRDTTESARRTSATSWLWRMFRLFGSHLPATSAGRTPGMPPIRDEFHRNGLLPKSQRRISHAFFKKNLPPGNPDLDFGSGLDASVIGRISGDTVNSGVVTQEFPIGVHSAPAEFFPAEVCFPLQRCVSCKGQLFRGVLK